MSVFTFLAERFDLPILDFLQAHAHTEFLDSVMPLITMLGQAGVLWIACAILLLFFKKYRRAGIGMGIALLIGVLLCNLTLKPLLARPRPFDYQLDVHNRLIHLLVPPPTDYSFPSGHTLASFEAATVLLRRDRKLGGPALFVAILIAFSRLYLYVHYPTDVLAGVILGVGIGFLGDFLAEKICNKAREVYRRRMGLEEE